MALCFVAKERYPSEGPHSVLYVVVDRDAQDWRVRLADLHEDQAGPESSKFQALIPKSAHFVVVSTLRIGLSVPSVCPFSGKSVSLPRLKGAARMAVPRPFLHSEDRRRRRRHAPLVRRIVSFGESEPCSFSIGQGGFALKHLVLRQLEYLMLKELAP